MRALIGAFIGLCFTNWSASARHHYNEGLDFLHSSSLVVNTSIIVIFGLIVTAALIMSLKLFGSLKRSHNVYSQFLL